MTTTIVPDSGRAVLNTAGNVLGGDQITLLVAHESQRLCKTWRNLDTKPEPVRKPRQFKPLQVPISDLRAFSKLLGQLEKQPRIAIVRGRFVGEESAKELTRDDKGLLPGHYPRNNGVYVEQALHLMMIDVDGFRPRADPVLEPVEACDEYIRAVLPPCFHGVSYCWQLSGSAGHPSCKGKLKAHLCFWLSVPCTSGELRAWAEGVNEKLKAAGAAEGERIDPSLFGPAQLHYAAAPQFADGIEDPVPMRSGLRQGARDSVDLRIDAGVLERAQQQALRAVEHGPMADPAEKPGIVGAFCRLFKPSDLPALLPGEFEACEARAGHFTWVGHASEGVFITPCGHGLVSVHATTETGQNRRRYIFDFVRLHLFAHLDEGVANDARMGDRPSFKAMRKWIEENQPEVIEELRRWQAEMQTADEDYAGLDDENDGGGGPVVARGAGASLLLAGRGAMADPCVCGAHLELNLLTHRTMLRPFGAATDARRALEDTDVTELRVRLHERGIYIGREDTHASVDLVARKNAFDPLINYVHAQRWDGVPRVETFLPKYVGTEDTPYTRAVSRYLWTALAGRALKPGIKADMAVVFVGPQGYRKSSSVIALAPLPDTYVSASLRHVDDETRITLQGRSIVELAELRGMRQVDRDEMKDFISQTEDTYRAKYARRAITHQRRYVFIGTTNDDDFLTDPTGNRRWLPVKLMRPADPTAITTDLGQLYAEARVIFEREGVAWGEAERLARGVHAQFVQHDEVVEAIRDLLADPATRFQPLQREGFPDTDEDAGYSPRVGFSMRQVIKKLRGRGVIGFHDKPAEHRVGIAFKRLGIVKRQPGGPGPCRTREQGVLWDAPAELLGAADEPATA